MIKDNDKKIEILKDVLIDEIQPWGRNPRKNKKAAEKLTKVIETYGFIDPVVVDQNNIIRAGHTRVEALKKLGKKTVPLVLKVTFANEDEAAGYAIADNKSMEWSNWDEELLTDILKELKVGGVDLKTLGFDKFDVNETPYIKKIEAPIYEVRGLEVGLSDLCKTEKYNELLDLIDNGEVKEEEKEFLRLAAARFIKFNFANIAEYYAKSDKEMQELMEKLALVIIDFDDAIANGFVELSKKLDSVLDEEEDES